MRTIEPTHFCDVPSVALCGRDLAGDGSFRRFYDNCTNCFDAITCKGCQDKVRETRLAPPGTPPEKCYPDPTEWSAAHRV